MMYDDSKSDDQQSSSGSTSSGSQDQSNTTNPSPPKTKAKSTQHLCAYCRNKFLRDESPCMPFCSVRCQRADLGNWLNEAYTLPADGNEEGEWDQSEEN